MEIGHKDEDDNQEYAPTFEVFLREEATQKRARISVSDMVNPEDVETADASQPVKPMKK